MKAATLGALAMMAALVLHGHASAHSKPQFVGAPIAAGVAGPFQIHTSGVDFSEKGSTDVQNWSVRWDPGAASGWHYHAGIVIVTITEGTLTLYNRSETGCTRTVYRKGQAFVEQPFHVHDAVNKGTVPVLAVSSELILHKQSETVGVARPAGCPRV